MTHPELYEDIGIKPPKGVIFYGPPGTGMVQREREGGFGVRLEAGDFPRSCKRRESEGGEIDR